MKKTVLAVALTGAMLAMPLSVGAEEEIGSVGFSISTLNNPFFVSMADGAEAAGRRPDHRRRRQRYSEADF